MFESKVKELLSQALDERSDLFLIDFSMDSGFRIRVIIDGDKGVTVDDCIAVSRQIEHNLDREEQDFSLQVMSAGVSEGLVHKRQYKKNLGRDLKVTLDNAQFEGVLEEVTENGFKLQWEAREPKPIGKGKVTVVKTKDFVYEDVVKSEVVVKFN